MYLKYLHCYNSDFMLINPLYYIRLNVFRPTEFKASMIENL